MTKQTYFSNVTKIEAMEQAAKAISSKLKHFAFEEDGTNLKHFQKVIAELKLQINELEELNKAARVSLSKETLKAWHIEYYA